MTPISTSLNFTTGFPRETSSKEDFPSSAPSLIFKERVAVPNTSSPSHRESVHFKQTVVYQGSGIRYSASLSGTEASEIVRFLLSQESAFSSNWINRKNVKGIFLKTDPLLLKNFREELRTVLHFCSEKMVALGSKAEEELFTAFIGNIIALIPYAYPEVGEVFEIPMRLDGVWKKVSYRVDARIDLTPKFFSSPIASYGLVSETGPPLLTFLGTTYPAGDGFFATLLSDFTPGLSVGDAAFRWGKGKIEKWLEGKGKVDLYGASLGGAFTFQMLRRFADKIGKIYAYNPPGLYPWDWKEGKIGGPQVNIYLQENDLVPSMGFFPEGENVHLYRVSPMKAVNKINAHVKAFTGSDFVTIVKTNSCYENSRFSRKLLTAAHFLFGILVALAPIICLCLAYFLIGKPLLSLASSKK